MPGCLGSLTGSGGDGFASAMDLVDDANRIASDRHGGQLLAVVGLEAASVDDDLPFWVRQMLPRSDPTIGDGRAAAWGYLFGSGMHMEGMAHDDTSEGFLLVLSASGDVLFDQGKPLDFPLFPTGPLAGNWSVDSDDAATTARGHGTNWSKLVSQPASYSFAHLASRTGSIPAWIFEAGRTGTGDDAFAAVDSRDGMFLRLGSRDPWALSPTENGTITGTAQSGGAGAATFKIDNAGHKQLEIYLEAGRSQEGGPVEFEMTEPGGRVLRFHYEGSGGTGQQWFQFDDPLSGDWKLTAKLTSGTRQPFDIRWCALGASACG